MKKHKKTTNRGNHSYHPQILKILVKKKVKAVSPSPRSDGKYHPPIKSSARLLSKHFDSVKLGKKSKRKIFNSFKNELNLIKYEVRSGKYKIKDFPIINY